MWNMNPYLIEYQVLSVDTAVGVTQVIGLQTQGNWNKIT